MIPDDRPRCEWATGTALMQAYHDDEWGVPVHDDTRLFEFLVLEGAQAGLSWETVLKKREHYRRAFRGFDPAKVARFGARDVERLMADAGIVRNRAKIEAAIGNARLVRTLQREHGSFDAYVWRFVSGEPVRHRYRRLGDLPATTPESDAMSRELKRLGFKFCGPTICYAFMQAVGMVNDHVVGCFRYKRL